MQAWLPDPESRILVGVGSKIWVQARLPDPESRIQVGVGSKTWMPDLESRIQVGDGYRIWVQAFGYHSFLSLLSPLSIDVQVLEGMEGEGGHLQYVEAGRLCHDVLAYMASEDPCVQVGEGGGRGDREGGGGGGGGGGTGVRVMRRG